jgi:hypothetical protein
MHADVRDARHCPARAHALRADCCTDRKIPGTERPQVFAQDRAFSDQWLRTAYALDGAATGDAS